MTRKHWQELAVVLFVIVPALTWILLPILTSDIKPWEAGDPVPAAPPSEERRVHNDAGFSIVAPPNWNGRTHHGTTYLTPRQVFGGRSRAGILVALRRDPLEDIHGTQSVEFLGRPAHLTFERQPFTFDDPPLTKWTYGFPAGGRWCEVSYCIAESHDRIPPTVLRYLETLRLSPEAGR